ncbi:MAG: hypothetical protein SGILL_001312 [Bacillariaceae sp.]
MRRLRCVSASAKFEVEVDPIGVVRDLGKKESESSSSSSDSEDGVETAEEGVQESESSATVAQATASPTASPSSSPSSSPTSSPTKSSNIFEAEFLEYRTADIAGAAVSQTQTDAGPRLIVGGDDSVVGAYPYYVYIGDAGCGGSLISPRVVLSAAHCNTDNGEPTNVLQLVGSEVVVGAVVNPNDTRDADDGSVVAIVERQIIHPDFQFVTDSPDSLEGFGLVNDFMLLFLDREVVVDVDSNVVLRLRNDIGDIEPGTQLSLAGLGRDNPDEPSSVATTLQELNNIFAINDAFCGQLQPEVSVCAGTPQWSATLQSACQGDSGGALVRIVGDVHYQVGVVSYGAAQCDDSLPTVYAQIPGNEEGFGWIQGVVCGTWEQDATFCLCESDCDCFQGTECNCEDVSRRFLSEFQEEYSFLFDQSGNVDEREPDEEVFKFATFSEAKHSDRPKRRLKSDKSGSSKNSKSGKSCKSSKCGKSEVGVCRL